MFVDFIFELMTKQSAYQHFFNLYIKLQHNNSYDKPCNFCFIIINNLIISSIYDLNVCLIFNPFMLNVFSHIYQLDESIFNFRVVGLYF